MQDQFTDQDDDCIQFTQEGDIITTAHETESEPSDKEIDRVHALLNYR
jgi:hypothetical protein